jgi:hypothetical protein
MSKQTAVEWLEDQIECFGNKHELQMSWATLDELLEQAKEMEKEQIEEAFANGVDDEYEYHINNHPRTNSEQYYNETYGGDK